MAGYAASAIPVWDAAWDRAATYQKVGIFQPQFETKSDTTLLYKKISPSRKNPKTDYWIWSPDSRNQNNQLTILTDLIDRKVSPVKEINHDTDFSSAFIDFTKWAFGN